MDLLIENQGITDESGAVQILPVHIHGCNLVVIIGSVVVNAFVSVAAGGINRNFVLIFLSLAAASLLVHTAKNVEELADTLFLGLAGYGVHLHKAGSDKP